MILKSIKIKNKIILSFISLVIIIFVVNVAVIELNLTSFLTNNLLKQSYGDTAELTSNIFDPFLNNQKEVTVERLFNTKSFHDEIAYLVVYDKEGGMYANSFVGDYPRELDSYDVNNVRSEFKLLSIADEQIYDIVVPFDYKQGFLRVGYFQKDIKQVVNATINSLLKSIMIPILISILFIILFTKMIITPIKKLKNQVKEMTRSNNWEKILIESDDELGELAKGFNHMMKEITGNSKKLKEAKNKAETILQSIGDGVFVIDKNYKIIVINGVAADLAGCTIKEATGKTYTDVLKFVYEETGEINDVFIKDSINQCKIKKTDNHTLLINKRGEKIPVAEIASPFLNEKGEVEGSVIVFSDMTMSREVEKMKSEFVSVTSHQLRTPLTAIKLFSEVLLDEKLNDNLKAEQKEYLNDIKSSIERMVRLVNDILNVTRIESGRLKIEPVPTNVNDIVADSISEIKPLAKIKKIKINFIKNLELPMVPLDQSLFQNIIHNLLTNAVRYSRKTKGEVNVAIIKKNKKDFIISVSDNGIGIPKEVQKRIFEKFFRADNAIKNETSGTGLGLYVVKMITESTNGSIWFESKKDKGTTFFIKLPIKGMTAKKGERGLAIS